MYNFGHSRPTLHKNRHREGEMYKNGPHYDFTIGGGPGGKNDARIVPFSWGFGHSGPCLFSPIQKQKLSKAK